MSSNPPEFHATTIVSVGPIYIFRNVFNRNQFFDKRAPKFGRSS